MRRKGTMIGLMMLVFLAGLAGMLFAQPPDTGESERYFEIASEIGRALPRRVVYDPNFEQYAVVNAYNSLVLMDALTFQTRAVLHDEGGFVDIQFSHDGRHLAVMHLYHVELWDTQTHERVAFLNELNGARELIPSLQFSPDDTLLIFSGSYPAPREIRVSENQRIHYPWLWHLGAARGEMVSSLPRGQVAVQMLDYPYGFNFAPDGTILAALPSRFRLLDAQTLAVKHEIPISRHEQDEVLLYESMLSEALYYHYPSVSLSRVDADTGRLILLDRTHYDAAQLADLSPIGAPLMGPADSGGFVPLHARIFGRDYRNRGQQSNNHFTVRLMDVVTTPGGTSQDAQVLMHVTNHTTGSQYFQLNALVSVELAANPAVSELITRDVEGVVTRYDLATGRDVASFVPPLRVVEEKPFKNRVLAYNQAGDQIVNDFERRDVNTLRVLTEDLRYARAFDRFFFGPDNRTLVTVAGTEWRLWDVETGEVLRRQVIQARGEPFGASPDGFRFLYFGSNRTSIYVIDFNTNVSHIVEFESLAGHSVQQVIPNPSWTRFLVVYSVNSHGPYAPGTQIAMYDLNGKRWLMAGDDLPLSNQYAWANDTHVALLAQSAASASPERVYGVAYAANGLPECLAEHYPDSHERLARRWQRLSWLLRPDSLNRFALHLCANVDGSLSPDALVLTLVPSPTPDAVQGVITPTPSRDPRQCLALAYPTDTDAYIGLWEEMAAGLGAAERDELAQMICEGIHSAHQTGQQAAISNYAMLIDAETGVRSAGGFTPQPAENFSVREIINLFDRLYRIRPASVVLNHDQTMFAVSHLPGELVIYRFVTPYETITYESTLFAQGAEARANFIYPEATPYPTYHVIGTARPTLTPTPSQTPIPPPDDRRYDAMTVTEMCPAGDLYNLGTPPEGYAATGRIFAPLQGDYLWSIDVRTGQRVEATDVPACTVSIDCSLSADGSWSLGRTYEEIFVSRPDGSDSRLLWDLRTPYPETPVPRDLRWNGSDTLEWQGRLRHEGRTYNAIFRDVMNVYPDGPPLLDALRVDDLPTLLESQQPAGPWAIASTSYTTGTGIGRLYWLINRDTLETRLFAEGRYGPYSFTWHPQGHALFYMLYNPLGQNPLVFEYSLIDHRHVAHGPVRQPAGTWSPDGLLMAQVSQGSRNTLNVVDYQGGLTRVYCLPKVDTISTRLWWSPDSRYIALHAGLRGEQTAPSGHILVVDLATGAIVDLTAGVLEPYVWAREAGGYAVSHAMTPTPSPSPQPTPTP